MPSVTTLPELWVWELYVLGRGYLTFQETPGGYVQLAAVNGRFDSLGTSVKQTVEVERGAQRCRLADLELGQTLRLADDAGWWELGELVGRAAYSVHPRHSEGRKTPIRVRTGPYVRYWEVLVDGPAGYRLLLLQEEIRSQQLRLLTPGAPTSRAVNVCRYLSQPCRVRELKLGGRLWVQWGENELSCGQILGLGEYAGRPSAV